MFNCKPSLLEDVREGSLRDHIVHRNDGAIGFFVRASFKRNVAAFWRSSIKPARFSARISLSPETLGSLGMLLGYIDKCPERLIAC